jgi:hypothetical protein
MSNKLEAARKKDIVDAVKAAGGYATRIEDQYRVGTLDLILSLPETGIVLAEAKRFTGGFFEPSPRQYIEMCAIDDGGGVALLIGIKNEHYYLHGLMRGGDIHHRGRVPDTWCHIGTDFVEVFKRWHNQKRTRK